MKKMLGVLIGALLIAPALPVSTYALAAEEIISDFAILMDAETGQVLFDKRMDEKVYPASTTKIMTGLLAAELSQPDETVTVSQTALEIDEWNSSNIALTPGEELSVESAMYALMLPSANDVANAIAEHVGGSQERFIEMMNQRAWDMGARNTRFVNAHGLHDDGHYTTAHDMALITRIAAQNEAFMKYFGAETYTMPPTNLQPATRPFTNFQYMLVKETGYYNPAVLGGKVGYTTEAQHTMSTVAERNGRTLICVVMHSGNRSEKFTDTDNLMEYGFSEFRTVTLPAASFAVDAMPVGDDGEVAFHSESDFKALLRKDLDESSVRIDFNLPESFASADELPAAFEVIVDTVGETLPSLLGSHPVIQDLTLDAAAAPAGIPSFPIPDFTQLFGDSFIMSPVIVIIFGASGVLLVVIGILMARSHELQKRRRARVERLNRRMRTKIQRSA